MGRKGKKSTGKKRKHNPCDDEMQKSNPNNNNNTPKRQKNKANRNKNKGSAKKNYNKFWVDKCTSNIFMKAPQECNNFAGVMNVVVSGVELSDNHTYNGEHRSGYGKDHDKDKDNDNDKDNDKCEKKTNNVVDERTKIEVVGVVEKGVENDTNEEKEKLTVVEKVIENITDKNQGQGGVDESKEEQVIDLDVDKSSNSITPTKKKSLHPFVQVTRAKSSFIKKPSRYPYVLLANGDCGDGIVNPFPKDEVDDKYWAQRKRFFTKFDDGIKLDKESWYSVTPEAIANHVAKRIAEEIEQSKKEEDKKRGAYILDAFSGCGGNAIGFAKRHSSEVELVICVDIDRSKLKMAANNASIYGIDKDKIIFIEADSTYLLRHCYKDGNLIDFDQSNLQIEDVETEVFKGYKIGGHNLLPPHLDAIFLSPPWGGPNYLRTGKKGYLLQTISLQTSDGITVDGEDLLLMSKNACKLKFVIYFLPRTINGHEVGKSAWKAGYRDIEVEKNVLNGKLKTVTIYLKH